MIIVFTHKNISDCLYIRIDLLRIRLIVQSYVVPKWQWQAHLMFEIHDGAVTTGALYTDYL